MNLNPSLAVMSHSYVVLRLKAFCPAAVVQAGMVHFSESCGSKPRTKWDETGQSKPFGVCVFSLTGSESY